MLHPIPPALCINTSPQIDPAPMPSKQKECLGELHAGQETTLLLLG